MRKSEIFNEFVVDCVIWLSISCKKIIKANNIVIIIIKTA